MPKVFFLRKIKRYSIMNLIIMFLIISCAEKNKTIKNMTLMSADEDILLTEKSAKLNIDKQYSNDKKLFKQAFH